jgi:glucan biosynthesis protein C
MNASTSPRRYDLDALRIFACYLLFLFHVGMVFNPAPFFHVRNDDSSLAFLIVCGFISLWHMPLFFLLAGWSAAASLASRGTAAFLRERWHKLAIPLIAGCVLFGPGIKYLELQSGQDLNHRGLFVSEEIQENLRSLTPVELPLAAPFDESFVEFVPSFFTELDRFSWSHLWFLAYLLSMTLVLLPIFARLVERPSPFSMPSRLQVYFPIIPLVLVQLTLRERFPGPYNLYNDWASVSFYATFLIAGFLMAVEPRLEFRLREEWKRAFGIGVAATGVLLAAVIGVFDWTPAVLAGTAVAGWCFVIALLGFAHERVTSSGPRMRYLTESAFPVFLLHQPVIVFLGHHIVQLPVGDAMGNATGIAAKFVLLLTSSIIVTLALYHFGVRPFQFPRALTGMKPLPRLADATRPTHAAVGAGASASATGRP